jgi:acyl-CoA thioester hydrolase
MRVGQGLFQDDRCTATAEGVVVMVDAKTGRPTPIPEALRQRLISPTS